jgi:transcriptional regulator with XRE-family HTH domain
MSGLIGILAAMPSTWTNRPFIEEVPRLLAERGLSVSALARDAGVSQPYLSRVLRQQNYKTPSADLARRCALALDLPHDYFPEYRLGYLVDRLRDDPELRDRLYRRVTTYGRT